MKTPVALIIFNRPDCTAQVLAEIAKAKPEKLFVIADGPRPDKPGEAEKCAATRAVIEQVDWPCEVVRNYSDVNLGCRFRPKTGLNWVFDNVDEAIILEDDCLPHPAFFPFCAELLERYRDDERVMMIGGVNFLGHWQTPPQSYYFSYFGSSWGWASWRRAWRLNDADLRCWPFVLENRLLEQLFPDPEHCRYWQEIFQRVYDGRLTDAWDYQWLLSCWLQSGFRIFPSANLISNIGFRDDATHTFGASEFAAMPTAELTFPLQHPSLIVRSVAADQLIQEKFCGRKSAAKPGLAARLRSRLTGYSAPDW